ncbi:MAG: phospho-sugar mutase [Candidatus Daviesbacteria bacterium]|nr:phospho-sugar mutase [Candidatus Daviesbacteria bacterium]
MNESNYIELVKQAVASGSLSAEASANITLWLKDPNFKEFVPDIEKLIDEKNWQELEDAFYTRVAVGTGGLRGPVGVGPNKINLRTIGEAAQGLSQFIKDFGPEAIEKGVVVGHEVRKMSPEFAKLCCEVFAGNGIKSYLMDHYRSTPELSFAVRHLGTTAGVQITASHNPRTDNGFKFYWSDGGQVVPPLDLKFMDLVTNVKNIERVPFEEAKEKGLIHMVGEDIDKEYFAQIKKLSLVKTRSAKIVFSPIHGAGLTNVYPILKDEGFDVTVVPEQREPDENFPTAHGDLINPEFREVMELPISLGEKLGADLVINSDPDADRIGVAVKKSFNSNELQFMTGNEVGELMVYFVLTQLKKQGKLNKDGLVIETFVTSSLIADIARSYGVKVIDDLLVGFKFIGEIIEKLENKDDFIFAAEESLGYLRGTFVRDKDAAISSLTLAEMVSELKDEGKTVIDYQNEIYEKYGYYKNILNSVELKGKTGKENIRKIMVGLRDKLPPDLAGVPVLEVIDRLDPEMRLPEKYRVGKTGDQLTFLLSQDKKWQVTARPSGTEPKIKYYIQVYGSVNGDLTEVRSKLDDQAKKIEQAIVEIGEKLIA